MNVWLVSNEKGQVVEQRTTERQALERAIWLTARGDGVRTLLVAPQSSGWGSTVIVHRGQVFYHESKG